MTVLVHIGIGGLDIRTTHGSGLALQEEGLGGLLAIALAHHFDAHHIGRRHEIRVGEVLLEQRGVLSANQIELQFCGILDGIADASLVRLVHRGHADGDVGF